MEKAKDKRVKYNKLTKINAKKSKNPMAKLNYRELQAEATKRNLPANLKHKELLSLVIAQINGRDDIVKLILDDRKMINLNKEYAPKSMKKNNLEQLNSPSCTSNFNDSVEVVEFIPEDRNDEYKKILNSNKENIDPNARENIHSIKKANLKPFNLSLHSPSCCSSSCHDSFSSTSTFNDFIPDENINDVGDDDVNKVIRANLDNNMSTPSPDALLKIFNLFKTFGDSL
ncbi:unnamed protein product [Brassicogethes aeneus]|uniref:Uncharacterized protein n=1 Tax=Brassicogethes aeneus TaxID=1431903 RepID=A0A9P0ARW0_BRAAE|nr:unnamed protein product [Brassicogethes aeneus]